MDCDRKEMHFEDYPHLLVGQLLFLAQLCLYLSLYTAVYEQFD